MPIGDILPEIALLLGAVAIILLAAFVPRERQHWCAALAGVSVAAAAGLALAQWGMAEKISFSGVWIIDRAATFAKLTILLATLLTLCLCPEWLRRDRRHGEFYALLLFAALGAIMLASAHDAMEVLMGVLLSSAASYPLVAFHRDWGPSIEAGMKYFLLGALANGVLVLGVVLMFGLVGDTAYDVAGPMLAGRGGGLVPIAVTACVVLGLSFKLAAFPFYPWMPDVAQGAPAPVAAFLSVVPKIGAALALARFLQLLPAELPWRPLLALLALATMTLGNLGALWQRDVRRLLGWSSVSQSGYALMALTVLGAGGRAVPALLLFLLAYAVANLAAFATVTALRGRTALADYAGLASRQPLAAVVLILALLSLTGIPPLVGFFGKLELFTAALEGGYGWLAVAAILNTVLSLFYYLRVVRAMVFKEAEETVHLLGPWSRAGMLLSGALVLLCGLGFEIVAGPAGLTALAP